MLNSDGRIAFEPLVNKDYIHDVITRQLWPEYADLYGVHTPQVVGTIDLHATPFVFFCGKKSVEKNAEKFNSVINALEGAIGLRELTTVSIPKDGAGKDSAPFIAVAPSWWTKSPVSLSLYVILLRLTPKMWTDEKGWDGFLTRMLDEKEHPQKDATYLRMINASGNLDAILGGQAPCMNRENYADYLLSSHIRNIVTYDPIEDASYPLSEDGLVKFRIDSRRRLKETIRKMQTL